jgi:hypothetical protein
VIHPLFESSESPSGEPQGIPGEPSPFWKAEGSRVRPGPREPPGRATGGFSACHCHAVQREGGWEVEGGRAFQQDISDPGEPESLESLRERI